MRGAARHLGLYAFFAFLATMSAVLPQLAHSAAPQAAKVPHNAFNKAAREDLLAPLRSQGEVRVIVGLQTAQEVAQPVDGDPDQIKEQRVSARQLRLLQRLAGHNLRNVKRLRHHHFMAMTVDASALNALLANPEVTSITEDRPNYPVLHDTPGITRADKAWEAGYRGAGQTVAVMDTGVDKTHPFFSGKIVAEACFSNPVGTNTSYCPVGTTQSTAPGSGVPCSHYSLGCWHGTHVAGIAAGRYGVLSPTTGGIAPDAGVIAIQVFQRECVGSNCAIVAYDSDLVAALDHVYSLRNTYSIASVNMSLGGDLYTTQCDNSLPAYKTVITNLRNANIATVIASGNDGNAGAISAPACISDAISVGSTTKQNGISSFSNSASFLSLLAPGSSVTSSVPLAYIPGGYGTASGTSMATPHVAGAWAVLKGAKPSATVSDVLSALQNTGIPITDPRNGIVKRLIQIGNTDTSAGAVGVLVGLPPTVSLTSPANNTMLTAPASVNLSANAADGDGTVTQVEFYRNATLIATVTAPSSGTPSSGTWTYSDTNVPVGTYSYTAKAYDNATPNAVTTSAAALVSVTATSAGSVNVAAQVNGGVATASSNFNAGHPASGANNGDRKGLNAGNGGVWADGTPNVFPDWLQVTFSGTQSIGELDVFSVQDNYTAPVDPNPSMTFTQYGLTDFQVQYWNGSAWADVPGGNVTGNNLIWRRFTFAPISTNAIRVFVNSALASYSRITEVEAWTSSSGGNFSPTVTLAAPTNNTMLTAPATVNLSANAADADGTVTQVEFYRNATLIATVTAPSSGTPSSGTWTYSDTNVPVGTYSYTAKAYDNATPNAVTTSAAALVSVTATSAGSVNVAAQVNGGVATASSTYSGPEGTFRASAANNGDRRGSPWNSDGFWHDGTGNAFPDSLQVNFSSTQSIGEIDVFTVQDNYAAPVDPTPSMTFTQYGITAFQVQYWNGSTWVVVPSGNVTSNNLVWRRFTFAPISTNAIRVLVTAALLQHSRIIELEAWTSTGAPQPSPLPPPPPAITLQSIVSGLPNPVGIENAGDGSGRLFIVQQGGQIKILNGGQVVPTPFLDLGSLVTFVGEQGLLGVAFHPNYASNGFFYVTYTRQGDGAVVIARYQRSATNSNLADPNSALIMLTVAKPFPSHNAGQLRFGPDGYLYIALGDGGSANDPGNRAQNLSTLLGKLLRIDVNNGSPYAIPTGNPFQNDGDPNTLGEIWAYGLRNPWRFSFDRSTGDLFIADVGQSSWEEVNFQAAGAGAGANYGWRVMEGAHCTNLGGGPACFDSALSLPILEYDHSLGCSVTGGHRYRGASAAMAGYFFYGDFCSGRIWGAVPNSSGVWAAYDLLSTGLNISTFGEDAAGEIYVADYNTGAIYRIAPQ